MSRWQNSRGIVEDLDTVDKSIAEIDLSEGSNCVNMHKTFGKTEGKGENKQRILTHPI